MKPLRIVGLAAGALLLWWGASLILAVIGEARAGRISRLASLKVEHILGPSELERHDLASEHFSVTRDGDAFFRTGEGLMHSLEGGARLFLSAADAPRSFVIDSQDRMLTLHNGFLGVLRENGSFTESIPISYAEAWLAPSGRDGRIYLVGTEDATHRVYSFLENGQFQILLESDEPVVSVTDDADAVYAATADTIVRIDAASLDPVFRAPDHPGWGPILSVAASRDGLLFFATERKVYVLDGSNAISIVNDSGGRLALRGDRLFVLDARRGLLYALSPASRALFADGR